MKLDLPIWTQKLCPAPGLGPQAVDLRVSWHAAAGRGRRAETSQQTAPADYPQRILWLSTNGSVLSLWTWMRSLSCNRQRFYTRISFACPDFVRIIFSSPSNNCREQRRMPQQLLLELSQAGTWRPRSLCRKLKICLHHSGAGL